MSVRLPVLVVAEYTGIPASRVYRWISAGRLTVYRDDRPNRPMTVDPDEVLELDEVRQANGGYLPPT